MEPPAGTVTFLFTDIEGSTRRWETDAPGMADALARHDAVLRSAVESYSGFVFATGGDGFAVAFGRAGDAVACAAAAQCALQADGLPPVRIGIHTGEAVERGGDYFGPTVNRAARLMSIAHGGQTVLSSATHSVVGSSVPARDLGEYQLRDLEQPERVFQLLVEGVANEFPRLRSMDTAPTNLTGQLTSFVGRERECEELTALLSSHRLVTVTGVGGVGKTRVACHIGLGLIGTASDGVWLLELASAEDEEGFADVVAVALRAPSRPGLSILDSVIEFLRTRDVVLIVDNCEHLLEPVAEFVEDVLRECPRVRVLATSREGLGVPGEQLWPLRSLSMPAADDFDLVRSAESVSLFVERASSVAPGFALSAETAPAVAEICRRLDGVPLAIELAAARVAAMSVDEIAARLDERFRLLTGGRRRAVERHHTLRAAVEWSYSLLDDVGRTVFDRLGVFAGSFDAAAAAAVVSDDQLDSYDVVDVLGELVAKSMLGAETGRGATRYQLLETMRQFALEQLTAQAQTDTIRRRHAEYFTAFAADIGPRLLTSEELVCRPMLRVELDNIRAALGWALDSTETSDHELAQSLLAALARVSVLERGTGLGAWGERIMSVVGPSDTPEYVLILITAGYAAFHSGDLDHATELSLAADDLAGRVMPSMVPWARMMRGNIEASRGNLVGATDLYREIVASVDIRDTYDGYIAHSILALYSALEGNLERAEEAAEIGMQVADRLGQQSARALALYAKAMVLVERNDEAARPLLEESLALTEAGASDIIYANVYSTLAALSLRLGDRDSALRAARTSLAHADAIGDRPPMAGTVHLAGRMIAEFADPETVATMGGAILEGWFAPMAEILPPRDRFSRETAHAAEESLGTDRFNDLWAKGATLTYEQTIALVLTELDNAIAMLD